MPYNEEADRKIKQLWKEQEAKINSPLAKEVLELIKHSNMADSDHGFYDHELGDYSLAIQIQELEQAFSDMGGGT